MQQVRNSENLHCPHCMSFCLAFFPPQNIIFIKKLNRLSCDTGFKVTFSGSTSIYLDLQTANIEDNKSLLINLAVCIKMANAVC